MNSHNQLLRPRLTEVGSKSFLKQILRNCNDFRANYINTVFNISMFGFFVSIVVVVLVIKYKGKLSEEERERKDNDTKNYILSKIKNFQVDKLRKQQTIITGLPHF